MAMFPLLSLLQIGSAVMVSTVCSAVASATPQNNLEDLVEETLDEKTCDSNYDALNARVSLAFCADSIHEFPSQGFSAAICSMGIPFRSAPHAFKANG
jgi:hypothetical protein